MARWRRREEKRDNDRHGFFNFLSLLIILFVHYKTMHEMHFGRSGSSADDMMRKMQEFDLGQQQVMVWEKQGDIDAI